MSLPVAVNSSNINQLPLFAPFLANVSISGSSSVTASLETIAVGQRAFVIRFSNATYAQDVATGLGVSFDVLLFESPLGRIDVRYYHVDADSTVHVSIGVQSANVSSSLIYSAGQSVSTSLANTLQGSTLSFLFTGPVQNLTASASLCLISFAQPGNIDYPWSTAISLQLTYSPFPITTLSGTAYLLLSATGTRTFINRFGVPFSTAVTLFPSAGGNLLYVNSSLPVDSTGLFLSAASPVQLPGVGPYPLFSTLHIRNVSGVVIEGNSTRVDGGGQAFLSSLPGFLNVTIGPANLNSLAPIYPACQAPISFTNGLRTPTQPSSSNGAMHFSFSYTITDGSTYSVSANLSLTASSPFANAVDLLGSPYQTLVNVTGTRLYTHIPSGSTLLSIVSGLSTAANPLADQRFYPYAFLSSSPGVYSSNNAPHWDHDGLEFSVSPSIPINGAPPGQPPLFTGHHSVCQHTRTHCRVD